MIPLIFAIAIAMGAFGAILMKIGASHLGAIQINSFEQLIHFLFKMFTDLTLVSGMGLYFLSAVAWSYLLTKLEISFVQPILALTYVLTPILAMVILNEQVPLIRWVGIIVIILGVFIVARTAS